MKPPRTPDAGAMGFRRTWENCSHRECGVVFKEKHRH